MSAIKVFPAGYEPPGMDSDRYTWDDGYGQGYDRSDGTARYGLGYATTHSYAWEQEHGYPGTAYRGGLGHEVRDSYGTARVPPDQEWHYRPAAYRPVAAWKTWRWDSALSARCARSANIFVRLYGIYRDALADFWSCPVHRHWGLNGAAGILPYAVARDGRVWVLMSERAGLVQHGGTWSCFGGAVDAGESAWDAAVRETYEELSGLPRDGQTVAEIASPCPECGWTYTTFVVRVTCPASDYLPRVRARSWETRAVAWVRVPQVAERELHPGFAGTWPRALAAIASHERPR